MYFRGLQVMRGWAAVAVVLYHLQHYIAEPLLGNDAGTWFWVFGSDFSHGARFFFVLSGFLMASLIDGGYRHFLPRRVLRIYPMYLLVVAGVVALRWAVGWPGDYANLWRCLTLLPFGPMAGGKAMVYPLGVEWTLVYEVFFYGVCAAFAVGGLRRLFLPFLGVWLGAIVACRSMPFMARGPGENWLLPTWWRIGLSEMNVLFIAGALAFYAFQRIGSVRAWQYWACGLGAATAYAAGRFGGPMLPVKWSLAGSFSLVVLGVCLWEREHPETIRRGGFWCRLGDRSYALYLVHVPVMVALMAGMHKSLGRPIGTGLGAMVLVACLVTGWVAGWVDLAMHRGMMRLWREGGASRSAEVPKVETTVGR